MQQAGFQVRESIKFPSRKRNVIPAWVPSFKFLGLGTMLGAITLALGMIIKTLRDLEQDVTSKWPAHLNPGVPEKPLAARMFQMLMLMGWLILMVGFIWALIFANGTLAGYWNNSISQVLNAAAPGSALLPQLGEIKATLPWLSFLRFAGMALLFTWITVAFRKISRPVNLCLQIQALFFKRIVKFHSRVV